MSLKSIRIPVWFILATASAFVSMNSSAHAQGKLTQATGLEGILQPIREVNVASSDSGLIKEIFVKPGDWVKAGDKIAELDSEDLQKQLAVAKAESLSRGRLIQVQSELDLQERRVELLNKLDAESKANPKEVQRAVTDLEITKGRLQDEVEKIKILELQVERLDQSIKNRTIVAPIDGIIVQVQKQIGEYVAGNAPSIVLLQDISKLRATFPTTETEVATLKVSDSIKVTLSDGKQVEGFIEFIPPVADPAAGWFMINVVIDNADYRIRSSHCVRAQ